MLYDYECEKCDKREEIIKPMANASDPEFCQSCGNRLIRIYSSNIHLTGTKVKDAEYYHAFGKVIKNDYERSEEIKRRGVIEVGNETPENTRKYTERYRKEKIAKDYED